MIYQVLYEILAKRTGTSKLVMLYNVETTMPHFLKTAFDIMLVCLSNISIKPSSFGSSFKY